MKKLIITSILIFLFFGIKYTFYQENIPKTSHFERFVQHDKMKNYGWMAIECDPDQEWKIKNRRLKEK